MNKDDFCDPKFKEVVTAFDRNSGLKDHSDTIVGMWSNFQIAYYNDSWRHFFLENGGNDTKKVDLGSCYLDSVSGEIKSYMDGQLKICLQQDRLWRFEYECSSSKIFRKYLMTVYPYQNQALMIVHSKTVETSRKTASTTFQIQDFRDQNGFVIGCSFCRRYQRQAGKKKWFWIPEWVDQMPEHVSHGICDICFAAYMANPKINI